MKEITNSELNEIEKSSNPKLSIHVFTFKKYKEYGYDKTQDWIRQTLKNYVSNENEIVKTYLRNSVNKNDQFETYKHELLNLVLSLDPNRLESWIYNMKNRDISKHLLFEILSELFIFIQFNPKTENDESYYDLVTDLLDRFTYLGKEFRIFPNDPDC